MALITCKDCGNLISDKAQACPRCGSPVTIQEEAPSQSVSQVTEEVKAEQQSVPQPNDSVDTTSSTTNENHENTENSGEEIRPKYDKTLAAILALIFGSLGIHHFYLGNTTRGVSYIISTFVLYIIYTILPVFTFGISVFFPIFMVIYILAIVDAVHYLQDTPELFAKRVEKEKKPLWEKIF